VKARPDNEPIFSVFGGFRQDNDRRFWIENFETQEDNYDIEADAGQMTTGCRNPSPDVPQCLDNRCGAYRMIGMRLKNEIAQQ
jgi:hypothetical protein